MDSNSKTVITWTYAVILKIQAISIYNILCISEKQKQKEKALAKNYHIGLSIVPIVKKYSIIFSH